MTNYIQKNRGIGFVHALLQYKGKTGKNRAINKNLQVNYMRTRKVVVTI